MSNKLLAFLHKETNNLRDAGLFREPLVSRGEPTVAMAAGQRKLVNLVSHDYLALAGDPALRHAAVEAINTYGLGVTSTRHVGGTLDVHVELEQQLSRLFGTEDTLLFGSRYHANTGLFESLFNDRDFVFTDAYCHPSLADGIRLSRARAMPYGHHDLGHLEYQLRRSRAARFRAIVTDGVTLTSGQHADLRHLCQLAESYEALVIVDDTLGFGVLGGGRGTAAHTGANVGLITGSFSHAMGGIRLGYASGNKEIIGWLRQKSRPILISNPPSAAEAAAAQRALHLTASNRADAVLALARAMRASLTDTGQAVMPAEHPIVAVTVGNAVRAQRIADGLMRQGIHVVGYCHPVVPEREARICMHVTAHHDEQVLQRVARAFTTVAREVGE